MNNYQEEHIITMDTLIDRLEEFMGISELTQYKITERFNKTGRHTYKLHNLETEVYNMECGQVIVFDDLEHVLYRGDTKVLNQITSGSIVDIKENGEYKWGALITFKDGTVEIERL